ncbi:DUF1697 domain-containing protein [Manganibacter manganicus]|uniref:DUF1697 domain-containing protein n=1 Tax=Manganibacter manganicus TaxID=1873176 RepID=A0A1V8RRW4_9HYPH|nr:DUF1697 domain-containing protein [Pseudaminobacter manganicus]OQM75946.1 hypothetical protein BFN67_03355 [Pseudaminobacter manganicus]
MRTYVALLYSVVITPQRRVVMADLRAIAEAIGLTNPRTLVASGNLVFESEEAPVATLEKRLETTFENNFGRHVDVIVRSAQAWTRLAAGNPFPQESAVAASQVAVRVMRQPVPFEAEGYLADAAAGDEKFRIVCGDPWIVFSRAMPNSRLLAAMNHKRLGVGTSRNWNTVRELAQMIG